MVKTGKAVVYIDGENFLHRVEDVLKPAGIIKRKEEIVRINARDLVERLLPEYTNFTIRYYGTKIRTYDITDRDTLDYARTMVESQRRLKRHLENQGVQFVTAGSLRVREAHCRKCQTMSLVFKEKGVDVRCAVDIVQEAGEGIKQIVISSDSDLLPALQVARAKGSHIVYVHHAEQPNFAMIKSSNETRVFTAAQVIDIYLGAQEQ